MIVCVCHRISDREIARHARAGFSFDDIQLELGVATQCGRCEGCARDVVAQCSAMHPVAAIHRNSPGGLSHNRSTGQVQTMVLAKAITESKAWNTSGTLASYCFEQA